MHKIFTKKWQEETSSDQRQRQKTVWSKTKFLSHLTTGSNWVTKSGQELNQWKYHVVSKYTLVWKTMHKDIRRKSGIHSPLWPETPMHTG